MGSAKVVIIGGGFAGLNAAKGLKRADVDILLLDKKNHHLFQPLLYQVATAALSPADIASPLREIFRDQTNCTVKMANVDKIDTSKKIVHFANGEEACYDYLIVATGASHSYFGHDEWAPLAPGLKTLTDALSIREKILTSFEKAERVSRYADAKKYMTFVIIGGGPTGVEMAGAISEIAYKTMLKNFRNIDPEKAKIYLLEGTSRILPMYPESLSEKAKRDLESMGVEVITGKMVTNITKDGVALGDTFIESSNVIWAAGNQASSLLKTLNAPLDRAGRVLVEADLSIPGTPDVFVIGDAACINGKNGKPLPGIAPVAIQQGTYVASIIKKGIVKGARKPFSYWDKGSLATIGTNKAVGVIGKFKISGFFAWLTWGVIHVAYLVGYRSRFVVLIDWLFHYFTGMRGARLIHNSIDETIPPYQKK